MFYSDFWYKLKEVSFDSIFMPYIETQSLSTTVFRPTVWKRYMDDIFRWENN